VFPKAGNLFVAWTSLWNEQAGKPLEKARNQATQVKTGRLRLVRSGADLYFSMAEGMDGEFKFHMKHPFGTEDLKKIVLSASTGTDQAEMDVRVTDVRIRAAALPNAPASAAPSQAAVENSAEEPPARSWLMAALMIGAVVVVVLVVVVGAGLYLRRRHAAQVHVENQPAVSETPGAPIAVTCAGCGKKLKVKGELAGKKIKCPQCGMPLHPVKTAPKES
jgi:Protein of unknown function (DUF1583)